MNVFARKVAANPVSARVVPFVAFCGLTYFQGKLGPASQYWVYLAKTVIGAWMVWSMREAWSEAKWRLSLEAIGAGVLVFALWVGLEGLYPGIDQLLGYIQKPGKVAADPTGWNPFRDFGAGSAAAWAWIVVRLAGSSLVVPPLEEVFYRSFLYRYIVQSDFLAVPLSRFAPRAFVAAAFFFGVAHREWLPGILCGAIYQGLVCWKGRLGDAMTAHAVTNFLLGCWIVWKGVWILW
jgi:CAAX prenyl protease-like protein